MPLRTLAATVAALALVLQDAQADRILSATAALDGVQAFSTDFESGLPPEMSVNQWSVVPVSGLTGGFSGQMLRTDDPAGSGSAATLTLTDLQTHTSIDLNVLLAQIGSLDTENFTVQVGDGMTSSTIFSADFAQNTNTGGLTPVTSGNLYTGDNSSFTDAVYDLGAEPAFDNIAHTSDTLTISFFSTDNLSDFTDESFGIDNLEVLLNGVPQEVPEPGSLLLLGLGLSAAGTLAWRRRRSVLRAGSS